MTSMRSELGKRELNNIFQSRKELNARIMETLEETSKTWGITCDRYEILRIEPPLEVRKSMQLQAEAERIRRKDVILSEAKRISDINIAEGRKETEILKAEAKAEAVEIKARKEKEGLELIANNVIKGGAKGLKALDYILKRKYYEEYANILKNGNVTIIPDTEGGKEGSSDVLAAVALMMQQNRMGNSSDYNRGYNSPSSNTVNTAADVKIAAQKAAALNSAAGTSNTSRGDSSKRTTVSIPAWDSIQYLNDSKLDSRR